MPQSIRESLKRREVQLGQHVSQSIVNLDCSIADLIDAVVFATPEEVKVVEKAIEMIEQAEIKIKETFRPAIQSFNQYEETGGYGL